MKKNYFYKKKLFLNIKFYLNVINKFTRYFILIKLLRRRDESYMSVNQEIDPAKFVKIIDNIFLLNLKNKLIK